MFIGLDIEHQQCTTPRTTRLSQTPSGRPAAHLQSPRAISQVREKRYDRMGFGFMHTVLKYQNKAVISCPPASGGIRDDYHSNRAKQGSYKSTIFFFHDPLVDLKKTQRWAGDYAQIYYCYVYAYMWYICHCYCIAGHMYLKP